MTTRTLDTFHAKPQQSNGLKQEILKGCKQAAVLIFLMSPSLGQSQDVQLKANVSPMMGLNMKTKDAMFGANLELLSVGNDKTRLGVGINPAVYMDENKSGKLGPSVQLTKKFDEGELRAIVGTHGGDTFVGLGGKVQIGGKKNGK